MVARVCVFVRTLKFLIEPVIERRRDGSRDVSRDVAYLILSKDFTRASSALIPLTARKQNTIAITGM